MLFFGYLVLVIAKLEISFLRVLPSVSMQVAELEGFEVNGTKLARHYLIMWQ
jgi:hypothetical protein